ncbi:hypothetical protein FOMPIDRAFT_1024457 [Fomitopsis schrenkii]|uniref:F-box domain-containing protein n=1 Tax=Fomitopsis schrenkii TaxID=2126942 RepID=S8FKQ9_FOMSC|nr:hypothetical protein FOMPIDRAFT_1024457 [Fomitopsis schrenkii]
MSEDIPTNQLVQSVAPFRQTPQLPVELISMFIEEVHSKRTLSSLSSTCHAFQALVEPILYRSIYVTSRVRADSTVSTLIYQKSRAVHV